MAEHVGAALGSDESAHAALLALLSRTIDDVLAPRVPADQPVALLDFPQTPNVGDSVIWLGAMAFLRRRGIRPCYTCSNRSYSREALAQRIGDHGTILLSGGGNFGDLYPSHQEMREAVVSSFPSHRIIQLPQTIHFEDGAAKQRARRIFDSHPDLTLLVRDRPSLEFARATFRAQSHLCPDIAFALGPLQRPVPRVPVVWLARSDKERPRRSSPEVPEGVVKLDWLNDDHTMLSLMNWHLKRSVRRWPGLSRLQHALSWTYEPFARERVQRGIRIIGAGRVVATNRLHGHILCMLLSIPHIMLDNRHGKVSGFYEAWTHDSPLAEWEEDEGRAIARALELAGQARRG